MPVSEEGTLPMANGESPEKTERAPCLDHDAAPAAPQNRAQRLEDAVRRLTGLTRLGIVAAAATLIVLLILLIVVVALAASWPRTPHSRLFPVCARPACLHASAQMLPKMNRSAAPCEDFWNYACGGWLTAHTLPPETRSKWNQEEEMAFRNRESIRSLVTTLPHPTEDSTVEWKLARLYESCMALDTVDSDNKLPLRKIISQMGGWHVLREFSIHSWDYRLALQKLQALYGVAPFFRVGVVPDPRNPAQSIIQVSPAGLGLPDRSYYYRQSDSQMVTAYMRHLRDVVQLLGATTHAAERFSDTTFHFEKRIAEITPAAEELQEPETASIETVARLQTLAPSVPLREILQAMFPQAKIGNATEVLLPSQSYIPNVSQVLSTTDRVSLNNYMMWVLALDYVPFLSREYRDTVSYFHKEMTGAKTVERWEACVQILQRFMGFALASLQEQATPELARRAAVDVVSEMFDATRSQLKRRLEQATWLQPELRAHALHKVDALDLQVGFPSNLLESSYRDAYYSKLFVQKNDFFQNIQYGVEFLREAQQERLTRPVQEHRWLDVMSHSPGPAYVAAANAIVVPLPALVPPLFDPQYPLSVLYGGLGVQLASAMVSAVLPWDVLYDADGKLLSMADAVVNQSALAVRGPMKFLTRELVKSGGVTELVANRTALATLRRVAAVRQAHSAMVEALADQPHVHQPAMETLESDAIFFLAHAQTLCTVSTAQQDDRDDTASFEPRGRALLKTVLRQMPVFTQAFSCTGATEVCEEIL
ncbi:protein gone early isoform X2 [Periplaneta americana]|uniref:protein gone early isoform X2 n=1 Tax=Periplaneta americana TaxID=6978 RepID=UPI0037E8EA68